jgi:hypothetical protein
MPDPRPIYRTDGEWVAIVYQSNLFDTTGEWIGWLDGIQVYSLDGDYVGYISPDGRLLRERVLPYRKHRRPHERPSRFTLPTMIPLPPMFPELSYSVIDVFEEEPEIFERVSELRPDAGERPLHRLADTDPRIGVQQKLRQVEQELLEEMVYGIIYSYGLTEPPVPVEAMATGLQPEHARTNKIASPQERVRIAEEMIERLGRSEWATSHGYSKPDGFTRVQIEYAARALLMPRRWILKTPQNSRLSAQLARRYAVTEITATLRLHDLE